MKLKTGASLESNEQNCAINWQKQRVNLKDNSEVYFRSRAQIFSRKEHKWSFFDTLYDLINRLFTYQFSCLLLVLFFFSCSTEKEQTSRVDKLPYYEDANFTPHWLSTDSEELKQFHQIPSFKLVNQHGDTITEHTFKDKIYVVDFFFTTCPGICPKMTASMGDLQSQIEDLDEVLLMSHSVMPRYDSVAVLKDYAIEHEVLDHKWHLVTGDRDHIYNLGRNAYFVEENLGLEKEPGDFLHTENFVLIDKNRHIRGIYNGLNKVAIKQLFADIKTLLNE